MLVAPVLLACAYAAEAPRSPTSSLSGERREPVIDWSKSVVSRGFGTTVRDEAMSEAAKLSFKEGESFYFYKEYVRAKERWTPLAEQGHADAQANLGWMAQRGLGAAIDLDQARRWYELAAAQGQAIAQNNLGAMYEHGLGVAQDPAQAASLYRLSAASGYRYAQYNLAQLYLKGMGLEKDTVQARVWLERAAAQGVAEAKAQLKTLKQ